VKKRLFLLMAMTLPVAAQTFEVAAIRPNTAGGVLLIRATPGGKLSAVNVSLQTLVRVAYRVSVTQISGPDWMADTRFDITAKGEVDDVSLAVMAPKIRNLLADRFGLKVRRGLPVVPVAGGACGPGSFPDHGSA
jgi:uncharacterized protein (TIGR03435 family)